MTAITNLNQSIQFQSKENAMENTIATFVKMSAAELASNKQDGVRQARITFVEREDKTIQFVEIVSNLDAPWIVKGMDKKDRMDILNAHGEVVNIIKDSVSEGAKHALWAAVEVYHQHRMAILEHGLHVFDVDFSRSAEVVCGGVAAWNTNANFARYTPSQGWVELIARNVGNGAVSYSMGDVFPDGKETKHDYEDMLISGSANFRLAIPVIWNMSNPDENGKPQSTFMDAVVEALELEREASIEKSREKLTRWVGRTTARDNATSGAVSGRVVKDDELVVNTVDGEELDLSTMATGTLFVYAKTAKGWMFQDRFTWDNTPKARNLVPEYRYRSFSTVRL
jgi:hypothetical protein